MKPYMEAVTDAVGYLRDKTQLLDYNDVVRETSVDDVMETVTFMLENYDSLNQFFVRVQFDEEVAVGHEVYGG